MRQFIQKHPGVVATVVINGVALVWAVGYLRANFESLEARVRDADPVQTRWIVDQHTRDIGDIKIELRRQGDSIAEIRSDVKLIAAWVRQQQEREARAESRP